MYTRDNGVPIGLFRPAAGFASIYRPVYVFCGTFPLFGDYGRGLWWQCRRHWPWRALDPRASGEKR